ncbi:MAG: hypothetical protein GW946_00595 [Candidatus Pacebacteria bacterium]|nr:hypothetical protein [Candidatus Paceibacterota bacterium]PIR60889.1 MAG: hypothetical protein COU67_00325 [Candidatus Pacebacteria bacterium CG10_big_fil_rev_8_21_14_0_10_44_54]
MHNLQTTHWIFARWYYTLAAAAFILLASAAILQLLTPKPEKTATSFSALMPGNTFSSKKQQELGEPIESAITEQGDTKYLYQSSFAALPNELYISKENKVVFIKEFVLPDHEHTVSQYAAEYGEPDLVMYDSSSPDSVRAHVFLEAGLVVVAHVDGDIVEQKWLFEPTTKEKFLAGYGDTLSEIGSGPE